MGVSLSWRTYEKEFEHIPVSQTPYNFWLTHLEKIIG